VTLKPVGTLRRHGKGVSILAFSADGKMLASGGSDKLIFLWDLATGQARGPMEGHRGTVTSLAFAPGGGLLASVTCDPDDRRIRFWDVTTDASVVPYGPETTAGAATTRGIWSLAYSPDGRTLACAGWDTKLYLMDPDTGSGEAIDTAAAGLVRELSFSLDGRYVATGGGGQTQVWDVVTRKEVPTPVKLPQGMNPVFVHDGLAGWNYGERRVILCDFPSGQFRTDWRPAKGRVNGLAASPDGRHLAVSGEDKTVRVLSAADLSEVATLVCNHGPAYAVAFSPDGTKLASGSDVDGAIEIWDLPEACHIRK
jgi:WD40 repeat protein